MKEENPEKEEWLNHERTRMLRAKLTRRKEAAWKLLLGKAEISDDADVRHAANEIRGIEKTLGLLASGEDWISGPGDRLSPEQPPLRKSPRSDEGERSGDG